MPWESTDKYIRSGHMPEDKYSEHRTIWISKEDGIKAIYGKIKDSENDWEVQSYLFMKSRGWDMDKAKKWFKEHKTSAAYNGPIRLSAEREKSTFDKIWGQNDAKYPIKAKIIDKTRCKNDWGIKKEDYDVINEQVEGTPMKVNHRFNDVRSTIGQWYKGEIKEDGIWAYGMISDRQVGKLCHDLVLTDVSPTIIPDNLLCSECMKASEEHEGDEWPCEGAYKLVDGPILEEISIVDTGAFDDAMLAPYAFVASAAVTPSTPDVQQDIHSKDTNKNIDEKIIETPMESKEEDIMSDEKEKETEAEDNDLANRFEEALNKLESLLENFSKETSEEEKEEEEAEKEEEDEEEEAEKEEEEKEETEKDVSGELKAENEKLKKELEALKADGNGVSRYEGSDETENDDEKFLAELKKAFNE